MLPDRMMKEIAEQVELHFGDNDAGLIKAAQTLADAGFLWAQIHPLLSAAYHAGGNRARDDAMYESGCCGCEHC